MKRFASSIIIGVAIILVAWIFSDAVKNRNKADNSISVTGLGSKDFVSDLIVWSGTFIQKSDRLEDASSALNKNRDDIRAYLTSKGVKPEQMIFSAIDISKEFDYSYDNYGNRTTTVFTGFRLSQNIQIESNDVDLIEDISRQVSELINIGIEFYSNTPQYYYTKLAELKIEMIAEATKDAHTRATSIAENADSEVGRLKNASMGVFQIIAQNSSEDYSWGGSFNTTSKRKTATITVKLEYETD